MSSIFVILRRCAAFLLDITLCLFFCLGIVLFASQLFYGLPHSNFATGFLFLLLYAVYAFTFSYRLNGLTLGQFIFDLRLFSVTGQFSSNREAKMMGAMRVCYALLLVSLLILLTDILKVNSGDVLVVNLFPIGIAYAIPLLFSLMMLVLSRGYYSVCDIFSGTYMFSWRGVSSPPPNLRKTVGFSLATSGAILVSLTYLSQDSHLFGAVVGFEKNASAATEEGNWMEEAMNWTRKPPSPIVQSSTLMLSKDTDYYEKFDVSTCEKEPSCLKYGIQKAYGFAEYVFLDSTREDIEALSEKLISAGIRKVLVEIKTRYTNCWIPMSKTVTLTYLPDSTTNRFTLHEESVASIQVGISVSSGYRGNPGCFF